MVVGILIRNQVIGVALIGAAGVLLLSAVVFPTVSQLEYGFPSGVKITAAIAGRRDQLHKAFEDQKPIFERCANLICEDPDTGGQLLETALAQALTRWRGPVRPEVQLFVLCWFVHMTLAQSRLGGDGLSSTGTTALSQLSLVQRIAVVLTEVTDLSTEDIAEMTGLSTADVRAQITSARASLAQWRQPRGFR